MTIRLIRQGFPSPPEMDTALSHALLLRVSEGHEPETLRLHRPSPIVAFGPKDRLAPGFERAVDAARDQGFAAIHRLAGGRAAVFHEGTIAFAWVVPDPDPRLRIGERFREVAGMIESAFRSLGVDARVGQVSGEYCPGDHSVNARGRTKLMGVGQRLVAHAAHVGGVIVMSGADRIRKVLLPVYEALGLAWDPATVGSLQDEVPSADRDAVERAILEEFSSRYDVVDGRFTDQALALARELAPAHAIPSLGGNRVGGPRP